MTCGIYKIENNIDHKCYIGQSKQIEIRFKRHLGYVNNSNSHCYDYPLYRAIRKYGLENFTFSILEECEDKELDAREAYYIEKYDSLNNGYNQVKVEQGGTKISPLIVQQIINELKTNRTDNTEEIGKKFGVSGRTIRAINTGENWFDSSLSYPIRPQYINKNAPRGKQEWICKRCGAKISKKANYCIKCSHELQYVCDHPTREELKEMIRTMPFTQIGIKYGVTDNAVRKWCKTENLPYRKADIKKYSDEEWKQI